jgi:hypothetical protein
MKKINLLCVIILALLLGCQKKNDCSHIDMSHYIQNIQKIHSKMDKGFFTNEKFNNDCCCYEVALPISCNEESDPYLGGMYFLQDGNIFTITTFSFSFMNTKTSWILLLSLILP